MKTATVREIRQNFGKILQWIEAGEEVTVTMHRKPVARVLPLQRKKLKKPNWPDFAARQKAIFGDRILEGSLVEDERAGARW